MGFQNAPFAVLFLSLVTVSLAYAPLAGVKVKSVSSGESVDLGEYLSSSSNNNDRAMLVLGTYAADFNAIEYAQRLRYYTPKLRQECGVSKFGFVLNCKPEAAIALADEADLDTNEVELLVDPTGEAGRVFGVERGWRPDDKEMSPFVKLFGMLWGLGAWATLPAVISGYIGNPFYGQPWIQDALAVGQKKGRWPGNALEISDDGTVVNKFSELPLVGDWKRRPLELATLRLQNMIGISLKRWKELAPDEEALKAGVLTQLGACIVVDCMTGNELYRWRDPGICAVSNFEDIIKALNKVPDDGSDAPMPATLETPAPETEETVSTQEPPTAKAEEPVVEVDEAKADVSIPYDAAARLAYEASDKSVNYDDFKTSYEAAAIADVIMKNKGPEVEKKEETVTIDVSIHYDAAARLAYEASDKSVNYDDFKTSYEAAAIADVIMKNKGPEVEQDEEAVSVDVSIPYDAAARLAYEASDKSMDYDAFKTSYEAAAVADVIIKNKGPKEEEAVKVDVSIPYDAAARLAYEASDKSLDYDSFKTSYEAAAVADVTAKNKGLEIEEDAVSVDVSIPYDAAARLAYEASDKSMDYGEFKTAYEAAAIADVIAKNKGPEKEEKDEEAGSVDLSIPYDAAARLAYEASDKSMDYDAFKKEYEGRAVVDVIAKRIAKLNK